MGYSPWAREESDTSKRLRTRDLEAEANGKTQTRLSDYALEIWRQKLMGKLNVIHKTVTTENNMLSF